MGGTLLVLAGASGAGKSTFIDHAYPDACVVSSDAWRGYLYGDEDAQRNHSLTFRMVGRETRAALEEGEFVISDQTALSPQSRKEALKLAAQTGSEAHILLIDANLEELRSGQQVRGLAGGRVVPDKVVCRHHQQAVQLGGQIKRGMPGWKSCKTLGRNQIHEHPQLKSGKPGQAQLSAARREKILASEAQLFQRILEQFGHKLVEEGWCDKAEATERLPETVAEPLQAARRLAIKLQKEVNPRWIADGWDHLSEAQRVLAKLTDEDSEE